ncbi:MAG: phosphate acyltransferase [Woeseiaceae bacterium]
MNALVGFAQIRQALAEAEPLRLAVAGGASLSVVNSLIEEHRHGLVRRVFLIGDGEEIGKVLEQANIDTADFEICDSGPEPVDSARLAVELARRGYADALVKGHIESSTLVKQILDKRIGILAGELLSNITVFEAGSYHKLFGIADNAIVPRPDAGQKLQIIKNTVPLFSALGVCPVKVALVAASEKLADALPATMDAAAVKSKFEDAERTVIVDGPFGYDICISRSAAEKKGITESEVAGDPDLLLFHDIESANAVGKAIKFHSAASSGGLLLGCTVPVLFNSRSDGARRRSNSLLLANILADGRVSR